MAADGCYKNTYVLIKWSQNSKWVHIFSSFGDPSGWQTSNSQFDFAFRLTHLVVGGLSDPLWHLVLWADRVSISVTWIKVIDLFTADRWEEELTGEQGFTAQSLRPQWLLTVQNGHGLFRFTCGWPSPNTTSPQYTCSPVCVCVCVRLPYLVESEIVRLQKSLKFGEKLVVVKAIDGLYITSTVIQVTWDLRQMENTNTGLSSAPFVQRNWVKLSSVCCTPGFIQYFTKTKD